MRFLPDRSHLAVVAARFSCGAPRSGAEKGPQAIIETGVLNEISTKTGLAVVLRKLGHSRHERSASQESGIQGLKNAREVSEAAKSISNSVYQQARIGRFVLTLGGDHSIGIGTVSGISKAIRERLPSQDLGVLWIDAHADINTPETSLSGRLHGMPVAFLSGITGFSQEGAFDWLEQNHRIDLRKFVYIGLRDVDEAELQIIQRHGIKAFHMDDVRRYGVETVINMALEHIGNETPLHASYDIDSLDPEWAPSTGFPVAAGLSLQEGLTIAKRLHGSQNLISLDLVEISPDVSTSQVNVTVKSGCELIKGALGVE